MSEELKPTEEELYPYCLHCGHSYCDSDGLCTSCGHDMSEIKESYAYKELSKKDAIISVLKGALENLTGWKGSSRNWKEMEQLAILMVDGMEALDKVREMEGRG